jgi:hypothetical protein
MTRIDLYMSTSTETSKWNDECIDMTFFSQTQSIDCSLLLFTLSLSLYSSGPFLRMIFSKLENMLQNSLHVNLLLTGIIARLAHYSQPLLRSLLLNHSLVLETNIKSLFQVCAFVVSYACVTNYLLVSFVFLFFLLNFIDVFKILSNLKSKLETISQTFNDFNYLVDLAHDTLYQRENAFKVGVALQMHSCNCNEYEYISFEGFG